jgi:tyrosyl-tRNA synthetase
MTPTADGAAPAAARRKEHDVTHLLDELAWRGLVAQTTDLDALREAFDAGPVTFYAGFDPTAPSLHHGHLVQLVLMRHLQLAGHHPLALVGGATGLIGDPRMSGERVLNTKDTVAEWVARLQGQISRFLDFDGDNPARMVNNLDWTGELSAIDFLREVGKHYRLGTMLAKDTVARRLASDEGISFTEFSYQILQGMDYRELHRRYGCTLQTGGNDQWGNLLSGVELIRKSERAAVHALTTPLITKTDGTKFGKSEGGAIWLDPEMMSPYAFYQFWLNVDDAEVIGYLKVFTFRTREQIAELEQAVAEKPAAREAQRALAYDVTSLVHGTEATDKVIAASRALFGGGDLAELDAATLRSAVAELPTADVRVGDPLVDVLAATGLVASKGAARRAVAEGGASVNNRKITDDAAVVEAGDLLHGEWLVLRRGKRTLAVARLADTSA